MPLGDMMKTLLLLLLWFTSVALMASHSLGDERPPNIVIMFTDDQGYGDLGCYGATGYETPHLDRMAAEGIRFTDFYVSSPVCSASRAALLTGCYHERVGISGALGPQSKIGLNPDEVTLAEICQDLGYATAAYGKWHLGRPNEFLPLNHGFDEYFGLPYSNDMWPFHPNVLHLPMAERLKRWPNLPLLDGNDVINAEVTPETQRSLSTWYGDRAVEFIHKNRQKPFFIYVAHAQPHVPLYVSDRFAGSSENGIFGDVIQEIDDTMGRILAALKATGQDENTLVLFTTDNGPWLSYGAHCGTAGPLREGKGTCWEGGVRVPFIARWPGKIPAGKVCSEPAMTIDVLPTVTSLIGGKLPEKPIDGKNIWPLLSAQAEAKSPHEALFFYYKSTELQAMRSGKWKLILPHQYRSLNGREGRNDGIPVPYDTNEAELELYDLSKDVGEDNNLASQHPEIVDQLLKKVEGMRADLGDSLTKTKGTGRRNPGTS